MSTNRNEYVQCCIVVVTSCLALISCGATAITVTEESVIGKWENENSPLADQTKILAPATMDFNQDHSVLVNKFPIADIKNRKFVVRTISGTGKWSLEKHNGDTVLQVSLPSAPGNAAWSDTFRMPEDRRIFTWVGEIDEDYRFYFKKSP